MAINAYCGVMGSGKSYEVVQGPLLDAIASGRRVVTNIDGINESKIHDYLEAKGKGERSRFGAVVHVLTNDIATPAFFPVEKESASGATVIPGFVQPGDLVVVDEAWKLWSSDNELSDEHMAFFRMHRHFTNEKTGVACDVVLMIQGIGDLHRKVKGVVELSFRMHKLKSLGLSSGYRVEQYEGWKQNGKTRVATYVRKYSKDVFPLYKSYAGVGGSEAVVDKRQNVLANKRLWFVAVLLVMMSFASLRFLWAFFHRATNGNDLKAAASTPVSASSAGASAANGGSSSVAAKAFSEKWRIAGSYSGPGRTWVVVVDGAGRLRVESPSMFQNTGVARVGTIDGERVSTFSGNKPAVEAVAPASPSAGVGGVIK